MVCTNMPIKRELIRGTIRVRHRSCDTLLSGGGSGGLSHIRSTGRGEGGVKK